jgi:inner membrane protein
MTAKTHQLIGETAALTYYINSTEPTYNPATFAAVLIFSFIGSLLPDIDQPTSKLWHYLPFGHVAAEISDPLLDHRNITHSILGVIIIGTGFYFLLRLFPDYWGINTHIVFIIFIISYLLHLLADMFTTEGIPLLFPYHRFFGIPPKPFDGLRIMSGKWFENLVIFPVITIYLIIFLWANYNNIHAILFK